MDKIKLKIAAELQQKEEEKRTKRLAKKEAKKEKKKQKKESRRYVFLVNYTISSDLFTLWVPTVGKVVVTVKTVVQKEELGRCKKKNFVIIKIETL